ncbi:hypothetical protein M2323_001060 [Rhodoblastus acidophilus]|nr:hypothetical protein [Rhodoblastus acidophilus]MCW2332151.1 hypothetical protein [Rhodoblastus acidophilus]
MFDDMPMCECSRDATQVAPFLELSLAPLPHTLPPHRTPRAE